VRPGAAEPEGRPAAAAGPEEGLSAAALPEPQRLRLALSTLVSILRPIWPFLIIALVAWIGWHQLRQVDVSEVRGLLRDTDVELILVLLVATAVNLIIFGLYDVIALGPLSRPPSATERWKVGVLSFAWSNFLTLGPLAGPALRLWLYRRLGVEAERSRAALGAIVGALALALGAWCAACWLPLPGGVLLHGLLMVPLVFLAAALLRGTARLPFLPAAARGWDGSATALIGAAALDWFLAWIVFHLALSGLHGGIDPLLSLTAFFTGQLIGLASFVPGGLGSADAYWLVTLSAATGGHDRVLAALLLYRLVYYVLPWAVASLVLTGRLVRAGPRLGALLRTAIASYSFLCGVILLASAATPAVTDRAAFLRKTVPLALVEVSHGMSVVLGFLLLVISRGLARGYRSSHRIALALFAAGALTTFLKGLDYEEAILALLAVAFLLVAHQPFHREGRLRPPVEFIISVGLLAVVLFAALGYGSLSAAPKLSSIFSKFGSHAYGARFLRGLLLLGAMVAVAALHFSLRAAPRDELPEEDDIDRALEQARRLARGTNPLLVASGDKAIFRGPPEGFIAYRTAGRFLVAYADPVGPAGTERELLAAFLELAAARDRDVILYQITPALLPVAHDFGFTFFKLGEEAIVDLTRFDLKGNKAKSWRHALNSVERAGGGFEVVPGATLAPLLGDLREVSDDWLKDKHVVEKRFSLGRFDERYLLRFPCALVRDAGGLLVGFANLLEGPPGTELSIDLMRYSGHRQEITGLHGVMDYLFLRLMQYGKERGYTRFNLGMAPLASVGEERWARPFERLAHLFFRHGEHWYNYQGLRRYKEKFDPIWEPRYMAYQRPWDWPLASTTTAALIAGGWRSLLFPGGERA
jgi:phosphatidylglycerol lysyltransferase